MVGQVCEPLAASRPTASAVCREFVAVSRSFLHARLPRHCCCSQCTGWGTLTWWCGQCRSGWCASLTFARAWAPLKKIKRKSYFPRAALGELLWQVLGIFSGRIVVVWLRKKINERWTDKHRNVLRQIVVQGGWVQKRLYDIGWSNAKKCRGDCTTAGVGMRLEVRSQRN